jgi:malate synthase
VGYLVPEGPDFTVTTPPTDPEIATLAGPQLVVPVTNARFALNAANARWGSLYDALYGTTRWGPARLRAPSTGRGASGSWPGPRTTLDGVAPLAGSSWRDVLSLAVEDDALVAEVAGRRGGARRVGLAEPAQLAGWLTRRHRRVAGPLRVNGLLVEVLVDRGPAHGRHDPAGIADVWVEAALSTIVDLEDSVACVDAADKVVAYGNWLGLMRGDLEDTFEKDGERVTRRLNPDLEYDAPGGGRLPVRGRALLLVRNVGH